MVRGDGGRRRGRVGAGTRLGSGEPGERGQGRGWAGHGVTGARKGQGTGRGDRAGAGQGPTGGDRAKDAAGDRARGGCDSRVSPQAKYLAQIILVGAQVVGRAFMRALRQEFAASRAAADARGRSERPQSAAASRIIGISLQEAQQILNVSNLNPEEIQKNYDHLFKVNDKSVGGSFYLQSKVVRAKERLDEELRIQAKDEKEKEWKAET
ncbi:mitochondrial import inner membrane translocase subunit TIM16 [Sarcoramphus papa]